MALHVIISSAMVQTHVVTRMMSVYNDHSPRCALMYVHTHRGRMTTFHTDITSYRHHVVSTSRRIDITSYRHHVVSTKLLFMLVRLADSLGILSPIPATTNICSPETAEQRAREFFSSDVRVQIPGQVPVLDLPGTVVRELIRDHHDDPGKQHKEYELTHVYVHYFFKTRLPEN